MMLILFTLYIRTEINVGYCEPKTRFVYILSTLKIRTEDSAGYCEPKGRFVKYYQHFTQENKAVFSVGL